MGKIRDAINKTIAWLKTCCAHRAVHRGSRWTELVPQSDDPISVQFCHQVNKASGLLDFLLDEGRPYHIPDQIIDSIEAARELVKSADSPPSADQRAKLLKAYRDLVAIPGNSVLFDFPPTPFWRSWWRAVFLLAALALPVAIFFLTIYFYATWWSYWYWPVGSAVISAVVVWGLYVFTGMVTDRKLNQIIAFCYIFTGLMLAASLLPWWKPGLFPEDNVGKAPVAVLRGCVPGKTTDNSGDPPGVKCGDNDGNYQWVLSIGGVIVQADRQPALVPEKARVYSIRGGVVVPLYVLVLAIFGGAVSMTRRVPEYQRRAMSTQDPFTNQQARESLVFQIMQVVSAPLIAIAAYYIVDPTTSTWAVVLGFGSGFASEPILLMIRGLVEKLSPAAASPPGAITVRVDPPAKDLEPGKSHQFTAHVSGAPSSEVTWLIVPSDAGSISQSGYYTAPQEEGKTVTITASSVADRTKSGNASVTVKKAEVKKE